MEQEQEAQQEEQREEAIASYTGTPDEVMFYIQGRLYSDSKTATIPF